MGNGEDKIYRRIASQLNLLSSSLASLIAFAFTLVPAIFCHFDRMAGPILTSPSLVLEQTDSTLPNLPAGQAVLLSHPYTFQQSVKDLPQFTSSI